MGAKKRILAIATGLDDDRVISNTNSLNNVRPYIPGLIDGLTLLNRQLGADFDIEYRQRAQQGFEAATTRSLTFQKSADVPYDLIFVMSTTGLRAAKAVSDSTPIVCASCSDHGADQINLGTNVTGISARRTQTAGDCFTRFMATVPTLEEVYVLHKPNYSPAERALQLVQSAAVMRKVTCTPVVVTSEQDIRDRLLELPARSLNSPATKGVLCLPLDLTFSEMPTIIDIAQGQKNLPVFGPAPDWVGPQLPSALGAYGVRQHTCGKLAAQHVNAILWNGTAVADLPVMQVVDNYFEWVISSAAAAALNIKIPQLI